MGKEDGFGDGGSTDIDKDPRVFDDPNSGHGNTHIARDASPRLKSENNISQFILPDFLGESAAYSFSELPKRGRLLFVEQAQI